MVVWLHTRCSLVIWAICACVCLMMCSPVVAGVEFGIIDLGDLGGGVDSNGYVKRYKINNKGEVVGTSKTATGLSHAFRTSTLLPINPATDDLGSSTSPSYAAGINDLGRVVGRTSTPRPFETLPYEVVDFNALAFGQGVPSGHATAVNNSGYVVGYARSTLTGVDTAYRVPPGYVLSLARDKIGSLATGMYSRAYAINNAFWVVGAAADSGNRSRAFLYRGYGQLIDIGTLGGNAAAAYGLNDVGEIVGEAKNASGFSHAFRYTVQSGMCDLGDLGGTNSKAISINSFGHIVGCAATSTGDHAFLWRGYGLEDLNDLIPSESGIILNSAYDINDLGQIVADGALNGSAKVFLLTPVADTIPPIISQSLRTPDIAANGDMITISLCAMDNVGVTEVTADGTDIHPHAGFFWEGTIPAAQGYGMHTVTITARDREGNSSTNSTLTYETVRIVGAKCADLVTQPAIGTTNDHIFFKAWGACRRISSDIFTLTDGSGQTITVVAPGHEIADGDYVAARGRLSGSATEPTITSMVEWVQKLK